MCLCGIFSLTCRAWQFRRIEHLARFKKKQVKFVSFGKRKAVRTAESIRRVLRRSGNNIHNSSRGMKEEENSRGCVSATEKDIEPRHRDQENVGEISRASVCPETGFSTESNS